MKENIKYVSIGMYKQLEEENRNLKIDNAKLVGERDGLKTAVEKLKQELSMCEEDRDNIQLLLEQAKEEIKKLKEYNGELIEKHEKDIAILCKENKRLEEKLEVSEAMRENNDTEQEGDWGYIEKLEQENEELKSELDYLRAIKDSAEEEIKRLEFDIEAWKEWKKEIGL